MIDVKECDEEIPKWDIALAALAREEADKLGRCLQLVDFQRLAAEYAIRFDDIMVTLFELVLEGEWRYEQPEGKLRAITREEVEKLSTGIGGRLAEADVTKYTGAWCPVQ